MYNQHTNLDFRSVDKGVIEILQRMLCILVLQKTNVCEMALRKVLDLGHLQPRRSVRSGEQTLKTLRNTASEDMAFQTSPCFSKMSLMRCSLILRGLGKSEKGGQWRFECFCPTTWQTQHQKPSKEQCIPSNTARKRTPQCIYLIKSEPN